MADTCLPGSIVILGFVVAQQKCFKWQVTLVEHHASWLDCHVELMRCLSRQTGDSAVAPVSFPRKGRSQSYCNRSAHIGDTQQTGLLRTVWFPIFGSLISHIATPTTVITVTIVVCI